MMITTEQALLAASGYEPSVTELLDEPMVRALMMRDGVKTNQLQAQLEQLSRAVAANRMARATA